MHIQLKSIDEVHTAYNIDKPKNPLISIIDLKHYVVKEEWLNIKFTNSFYNISLKDSSCGLEYGRNTYDFQDGVLSFMAPGQVYSVSSKPEREIKGWMLVFHPELIRNSSLGKQIHQYNFFSYDVHEALHLSEQEQKTLTDCVTMIDTEIKERIDKHSNKVIISGLELLLNLCTRFYERQFTTRTAKNKDILSLVENNLKSYYKNANSKSLGLPTVKYLAEKVNLSPGYLSDLLRNETGRSAKEHILEFIVNQAKNKLLGSSYSVSEIAYDLGFEYPQHFSKVFKSKTGISPSEYRLSN